MRRLRLLRPIRLINLINLKDVLTNKSQILDLKLKRVRARYDTSRRPLKGIVEAGFFSTRLREGTQPTPTSFIQKTSFLPYCAVLLVSALTLGCTGTLVGEWPETSDQDHDGVLDSFDNCPSVHNPGQKDSDGDGRGDACGKDSGGVRSDGASTDLGRDSAGRTDGQGKQDLGPKPDSKVPVGPDTDKDGVVDALDNCPTTANSNQADYNKDGKGDACTQQDGTVSYPFIIPYNGGHYAFTDARNTASSLSDAIDTYPTSTADESGKEYIYAFRVDQTVRFAAEVTKPEPTGVDIDVHLLSALSPVTLIGRDDLVVHATLKPGIYYLSLDSFQGKMGVYTLDVMIRPQTLAATDTFNAYLLKAVTELKAKYGLLGYDSAVLTHDISYGSKGTISATKPPRTMCVAAVMEVILTAMQIYAKDTGDSTIFDFLPKKSFETLSSPYLKAHLWVNYTINAGGSADAVRHFGMGMTVPFKELSPGSFINLNRTSGSGHAVIFLSFIDISGKEYTTWNSNIIGFKYFSSQGGYDAGSGGLDYRYAIFSKYGSPAMPYKRDLNVIESDSQVYLNTGLMLAPSRWLRTSWSKPASSPALPPRPEIWSRFDAKRFAPLTADDLPSPTR